MGLCAKWVFAYITKWVSVYEGLCVKRKSLCEKISV